MKLRLVSEGLLFVSFFWTSFHSLSSPSLGIWPGEGFYVPDPCELTFANTVSKCYLTRIKIRSRSEMPMNVLSRDAPGLTLTAFPFVPSYQLKR